MVKNLTCNSDEENWKKKYTTVRSTRKPRKDSKRATVKV
jgi:hypothetical protein